MRYRWSDIKNNPLYKRWKTDNGFIYVLHRLKKERELKACSYTIEDRLCDLRAINLRKTRLPNIKISNSNMTLGQFFGSNLQYSEFTQCLLCDGDLALTNLSHGIFKNCNLSGAYLKRANLCCSKWYDCDLTGIDLTRANLRNVVFDNVILDGALLWKTHGLDSIKARNLSVKGSEIDIETFNSITDYILKNAIMEEGIIRKYEYDIALSFAGEDREIAEKLAEILSRKKGLRVFYDKYEQVNLWGKNLYDHLIEVYEKKAKYCVILISKNYVKKVWTNLERQAAQARALKENEEYILPIKIDNSEIKGLLNTVAFINLKDYDLEVIADMIVKKVKNKWWL